MTGVKPAAAIHAVAETAPARALIAAALRLAVVDAERGDAEAVAWLCSDACVNLLEFLVPATSGMSAKQLQAELLARLPVQRDSGAERVETECEA